MLRFTSHKVIFQKQTEAAPQLLTNLVKKKGSSRGPCEASRDELGAIGQDGVAVCTGEEASATNMIQKNSSHFENLGQVYTRDLKARKKDCVNGEKSIVENKTQTKPNPTAPQNTHRGRISCKPIQIMITEVPSVTD